MRSIMLRTPAPEVNEELGTACDSDFRDNRGNLVPYRVCRNVQEIRDLFVVAKLEEQKQDFHFALGKISCLEGGLS
jgi:hypothetical protein